MSFFGPSRSSSTGDSALNEILNTQALRIELALITALCSDALRRSIEANYDLTLNGAAPIPDSNTEPDTLPEYNLIDISEPETLSAVRDEVIQSRIRRRTEIQSNKSQGLRRAALTFFDKWQVDVLRRLGDILAVRPDAIRTARSRAKAQAAQAAKERQDREYLAWANGEDVAREERLEEDSILPEGMQLKILQLPKEKRVIVLDSVLLLLLSLEHYTAHSRILMQQIAKILQLPSRTLVENESKVASALLASAASQMSAEESTKKQAAEDAPSRKWKVGLATVAGAALIGVTGGLAAPILAASLGSIMGGIGLGAVASLLGPLATNVVLVGGLFGAYGGRMTGRIAEKYASEVKDFKFLPTAVAKDPGADNPDNTREDSRNIPLEKSHRLRIAIGISGWLSNTSDFLTPWQVLSNNRIETFALQWETEALMLMGRSLLSVLGGYAWNFAKFQVLTALVAGLWPLGLLQAANILDSPFAIAQTRAEKAGKVLAIALISKVQGERPVTLIGYSLGARVIYYCLLELAEQNAFGLVESVIMMGTPAPSNAAEWRRIRAMVMGRVVNIYSTDDVVLGFLYRASSAQFGVAGIQPVKDVYGVENHDFTDMVRSHARYSVLVGTILQRIGFEDLDMEVVQRQQAAAQKSEDAEKSTKGNVTETKLAKEDGNGHIMIFDADDEGRPIESTGTQTPAATMSLSEPLAGLSIGDTPPSHRRVQEEDHFASHRGTSPSSEPPTGYQTSNPPPRSHHRVEEEDHDYASHDGPIQMIDEEELGEMTELAPEPEPDDGPANETVRFGTSNRGFNVEWHNRDSGAR